MDWIPVAIVAGVVLFIVGLAWYFAPALEGSGSSSSSGSSKSSLGFTVGSDGVSPHLDVSDSVGIDLKDGSITVGSGPVRFDLDGSGPKFKF